MQTITKKQLLLAETVEAIEGGCLLHATLSSRNKLPDDLSTNDVNSSAHLINDRNTINNGSHLIFHKASRNLLQLSEPEASANIHAAIQSFIEGEFLQTELINLIRLHAAGNGVDQVCNYVEKAERIKYLKCGRLLGNACKSMVNIVGLNDNQQNAAFEFGRNFAAALQTHAELSVYNSDLAPEAVALDTPLLFAMEETPELNKLITEHEACSLTAAKIFNAVRSSNACDKTSSLLHMYAMHSIEALRRYADTHTKAALLNMIFALKR